ncbi:hypothetical protein IB278_15675 [Variovorax sp. VRV01]|uniref:hypothetical protein n=1 Tax=Variovorax sp. VRV01 TaxID=2769259 RepID=UPI0017817D36|nr:hypothetical protein [Variovorax sp. VRV01]MBD9665414.1 hypothetical protein [Variovorax sp. VRV01]
MREVAGDALRRQLASYARLRHRDDLASLTAHPAAKREQRASTTTAAQALGSGELAASRVIGPTFNLCRNRRPVTIRPTMTFTQAIEAFIAT